MTAETPVTIDYLEGFPNFLSVCTSWAFGQWGCQSYGSYEQTRREFEAATSGSMPLTLIAIENAVPVGMITLADRDFDGKSNLSPWLKSLYVHPFHRNKGIAALLIKRLEQEALRLGCKSLYLVTEDARVLYEKSGWQAIDYVQTPFGAADLMTKVLPESPLD
ncbi:GNAT family N-acetyltransferase [Rhizobium johnstonii]|uniref:GNAT family N-acetyltransferase n=1 Tax=Rhizobium TaxID=379 RepID=UPI00102F446D|nr:GNAT family N-acetyltransferase [Rhizobium leguminosarum]TBF43806.1 GNAT family N-acetyltransferase [Rhizobium leguminosarum]TBF86258.1 GNAT family N-acetyltransferase [Rhizobium leguminosarum]TBG09605.1 GNAT family N-acetyltransferase [Rhizobium leguminosarum]TBG28717.1 GNAT family N-acetyltransferase [Rhizobium leguminosarum]TBG52491.1 GNAT family N-acetyltransferase [Rhizobium leguminosarum]